MPSHDPSGAGSPPPGDASEALDRIDAALLAERPEEALVIADQAIARWPDDAELHHARGVALRHLDRPEDALEAMEHALSLDRDLAEAWLDASELLAEELGEPVEALEMLAEARRRIDDEAARVEIEYLRGIALGQLEDWSGALHALDAAAGLDPGHAAAQAERGAVLVELLRFEEAETALRRSLELDAESARAHELLAFVLDYSGRRELAVPHFRRAGELDPGVPAQPPRVTETEFDGLVDEALATIPDPFASRLRNVEISVENYADRDTCRRHDCSPTVLGLYVGVPLPEKGHAEQGLPDRIILFQRSLENASRSREELIEEIAVTLRHEIGHLLGFSEDELHERGHG